MGVISKMFFLYAFITFWMYSFSHLISVNTTNPDFRPMRKAMYLVQDVSCSDSQKTTSNSNNYYITNPDFLSKLSSDSKSAVYQKIDDIVGDRNNIVSTTLYDSPKENIIVVTVFFKYEIDRSDILKIK